ARDEILADRLARRAHARGFDEREPAHLYPNHQQEKKREDVALKATDLHLAFFRGQRCALHGAFHNGSLTDHSPRNAVAPTLNGTSFAALQQPRPIRYRPAPKVGTPTFVQGGFHKSVTYLVPRR